MQSTPGSNDAAGVASPQELANALRAAGPCPAWYSTRRLTIGLGPMAWSDERGRGSVGVGQRPSRSRHRSPMRSSKLAMEHRSGTPSGGKIGSEIRPRRTISSNIASPGMALRPAAGGTSSATTRSRSVTKTVSPSATARIYSSRSFFAPQFNGTHLQQVAAGSCPGQEVRQVACWAYPRKGRPRTASIPLRRNSISSPSRGVT